QAYLAAPATDLYVRPARDMVRQQRSPQLPTVDLRRRHRRAVTSHPVTRTDAKHAFSSTMQTAQEKTFHVLQFPARVLGQFRQFESAADGRTQVGKEWTSCPYNCRSGNARRSRGGRFRVR